MRLGDPGIYQTILENLPLGVYVVDRERKIVFWNCGAERITGYLRHEMLGRFCQSNLLAHCTAAGQLLCGEGCPVASVMLDARPREAKMHLRHRLGHRIEVKVEAVAIRDEGGAVIGAAETFWETHDDPEAERHRLSQWMHGCLDQETAIANHRFVDFRLRESLALLAEYHLPFGVLRIRIDDLAEFREAHGREACEGILHRVAQTLQGGISPGDLVGRYGENEFVVMLADVSEADLGKRGRQYRELLQRAELLWWGDRIGVTGSVGGAMARPEDGVDSLLARAEQALLASAAARAQEK
jgi:diguanylate cyclase (GGDEF)-like protein/PAS domain S-box-containing protein